jgi:hypothetical protein
MIKTAKPRRVRWMGRVDRRVGENGVVCRVLMEKYEGKENTWKI